MLVGSVDVVSTEIGGVIAGVNDLETSVGSLLNRDNATSLISSTISSLVVKTSTSMSSLSSTMTSGLSCQRLLLHFHHEIKIVLTRVCFLDMMSYMTLSY
jgi:hypothetical protein